MMGQKVKMINTGEFIVNFNMSLAKKLGFNHLFSYSLICHVTALDQ